MEELASLAEFVGRYKSEIELPFRYVAAPATVGGASASPFPVHPARILAGIPTALQNKKMRHKMKKSATPF